MAIGLDVAPGPVLGCDGAVRDKLRGVRGIPGSRCGVAVARSVAFARRLDPQQRVERCPVVDDARRQTESCTRRIAPRAGPAATVARRVDDVMRASQEAGELCRIGTFVSGRVVVRHVREEAACLIDPGLPKAVRHGRGVDPVRVAAVEVGGDTRVVECDDLVAEQREAGRCGLGTRTEQREGVGFDDDGRPVPPQLVGDVVCPRAVLRGRVAAFRIGAAITVRDRVGDEDGRGPADVCVVQCAIDRVGQRGVGQPVAEPDCGRLGGDRPSGGGGGRVPAVGEAAGSVHCARVGRYCDAAGEDIRCRSGANPRRGQGGLLLGVHAHLRARVRGRPDCRLQSARHAESRGERNDAEGDDSRHEAAATAVPYCSAHEWLLDRCPCGIPLLRMLWIQFAVGAPSGLVCHRRIVFPRIVAPAALYARSPPAVYSTTPGTVVLSPVRGSGRPGGCPCCGGMPLAWMP